MNPSVLFVFILSALLGVLRAADLAFGTDAVTGLCLVGSVWWRYLALGIVVLAAVLVGRTQPSRSEAVRSRRPLAGVLAFAGAVCFLAAAGAQIALGAASGLGGFVRCILECVCSVWLSTMGRCWLSPDAWKKPFGGLYLAVAGSLLFYWNVLMRFMENSSSWHRVQPTAAVWQVLAVLVFLAALLTGLGVFDDIAKHAGAGTLVPITGFANAVVSPAIEYKSEGFVLGLGAKMFTIAGPVIVYGTLASVIYGIILYIMSICG